MSARPQNKLVSSALCAGLLLAACGGPDAPAHSSGTPTSAASPASPSADPSPEGVWFAEPPSPHPQEDWAEEPDGDFFLTEDPPEGDEIVMDLEAEFEDIEGAGPDDEDTAELDPCDLVTVPEWEALADAPSAGTMPLEDGDVCGYLTEDDNVRLAVGAFSWAAGPRLVDGEDAFEELEPGMYWATQYPVEQSSMLVVETPQWDLGFEVSSRDELPDLRERLLELAAVARERLP